MRPLLEPTPPAINPLQPVALYREPILAPRVETFVGNVQNSAAIDGVRVVYLASVLIRPELIPCGCYVECLGMCKLGICAFII